MKSNSLVNWMGAGVLALSLAVLPSLSPAAQATAPGDATAPTTTTTTADDNDGFDWGWLGLLGLIGLAGLKGRDRDTSTSYSDRTTTTPASNNPRY
ncbi:WGxxGxxG family protein [Nodosilinea sp. PGN35]|uniref:WGxxGxxG family protein n=1 Tax=Nodosilinea sp. PGN35 TaxID=3020489 RepID=UPI0023B260DE|nr:WGxxGxxG family protein [Nodosilinea sp. TSF1-S3]MDF0366213.1 WGxxGxxG-CTERM domain-containing protein [Nodosilinea sp. TSF1-S3]